MSPKLLPLQYMFTWLKKILVLGVILGISLSTYPLNCLAMDCPTLHAVATTHACCNKQNEAPIKIKALCCVETPSQPEASLTPKISLENDFVTTATSDPILLPPLQEKMKVAFNAPDIPIPSPISLRTVLIL